MRKTPLLAMTSSIDNGFVPGLRGSSPMKIRHFFLHFAGAKLGTLSRLSVLVLCSLARCRYTRNTS